MKPQTIPHTEPTQGTTAHPEACTPHRYPTLFEQGTILTMEDEGGRPRIVVGTLAVDKGRIVLITSDEAEVAAFKKAHPEHVAYDCRGKLVMPGLINTHCHAGMTLQRCTADDIPLMPWLNDHIWPFEAQQNEQDIVVGMTLAVQEMLLGGVTSFVDMYFHEDCCAAVPQALGMRALLGCSYFDHNVDEAISDAERALRVAEQTPLVRIALAPHAPYTVTPENYLKGKEVADRLGLMMMTHLAETRDEERIVMERYGCRPVEHLDRLGLLNEKMIAAHCIWCNDEEVDLLAERGVIISHNPQSNMKIASGVAPVVKYLRAGATVTVGTDGPCSNNDLDMFDEMRTASLLQKCFTADPTALTAYETLRMATVNAAPAMGYERGTLGVLRPGALADLVVLDLQKPHLQPLHDIVSAVVYCAKASDVEHVMVDGQMVVQGRRLFHGDPAQSIASATEHAKRVLAAL